MKTKQKTLMVIGAGLFQVPAIETAKSMGLRVLAVDKNPEAPGRPLADFFEPVSIAEIDRVVDCADKWHKKVGIDGVIMIGTDYSCTPAAVADRLGLVGVGPEVALKATDKFEMRKTLVAAGVPCPEFKLAHDLEMALAGATEIGYPLVIKPVDSMGGRGVRRVDSNEDLRAAYPATAAFSPTGRVLLENYMPGPELSIDTIVYNGRVHLLTAADRIIEFEPYFVETGHTIPSILDSDTIREAFEFMIKGIEAIGVGIGPSKCDMKITPDGPRIGEITVRLSGGYHCQHTTYLATGMNNVRAAIDIALGQEPSERDLIPVWHRYAGERALLPGYGRIKSISGYDEAERIRGVKKLFCHVKPGDVLKPLTSNMGKAGNVVACGNTRDEMERAFTETRRTVRFDLE
ncbi:ATP-grasp domain-containing protein [candidate division KSB1 bacterium]